MDNGFGIDMLTVMEALYSSGPTGAVGTTGPTGPQGFTGPTGPGLPWTATYVEDFLNQGATTQVFGVTSAFDTPTFLDTTLSSGARYLHTGSFVASGATLAASAGISRSGWASKGLLALSHTIGATTGSAIAGSANFIARGGGLDGSAPNLFNAFFTPSGLGASGVFEAACGVGIGGTGAGALSSTEGNLDAPSGPGLIANSAFGLCLFSDNFDGPASVPTTEPGVTGSFYIDSTADSSLQVWVYRDNNGDSFLSLATTTSISNSNVVYAITTPPSLDTNALTAWNYLKIRVENTKVVMSYANPNTGQTESAEFDSGSGFYTTTATFNAGTFGCFISNPDGGTKRVNYALDFLNAATIEDNRQNYFY